MEINTHFLCARPSFLEGIARIMDFGNTLNAYNTSPTGQEADNTAIWMDWTMIGQDFRNTVTKFEIEETDTLAQAR